MATNIQPFQTTKKKKPKKQPQHLLRYIHVHNGNKYLHTPFISLENSGYARMA